MKFKKYYGAKTKSRSGFEQKIKTDLDQRGIKYGYETIKLKYTKICCGECGAVVQHGTYTPDFIIDRQSGVPLIVEGKGYFDSPDRTKMLSVKRDNPTADIRFLFVRDNPIRKGSKTKYSDWCNKHGFLYDFGVEVPKGWLK